MEISFRHLALYVNDLQAAEVYYKDLFRMRLIGREAVGDDGLWYTLPFDKSWRHAEAAGIKLGMTALQNGKFVLALFSGAEVKGQVFAIGLTMSEKEIAGIRDRLPAHSELGAVEPDSLEFFDPYQIIWQISAPGSEFRTAGDHAGRWLKL